MPTTLTPTTPTPRPPSSPEFTSHRHHLTSSLHRRVNVKTYGKKKKKKEKRRNDDDDDDDDDNDNEQRHHRRSSSSEEPPHSGEEGEGRRERRHQQQQRSNLPTSPLTSPPLSSPPPSEVNQESFPKDEQEQPYQRQEVKMTVVTSTSMTTSASTFTSTSTSTSASTSVRSRLKSHRLGSKGGVDLWGSQPLAQTSGSTSSTHPTPTPLAFRPPLTSDPLLIPLSTPPDFETHLVRARLAAHTPRTPPRDLTEVLRDRGVSPSPEGLKDVSRPGLKGDDEEEVGVELGVEGDKSSRVRLRGDEGVQGDTLGGLRKGKRRRMMTRTESLGDKDDLFLTTSTTTNTTAPHRVQEGLGIESSSSSSSSLAVTGGLGLKGKKTLGRVNSDSWGLVSPDRNQFIVALPVEGGGGGGGAEQGRTSPITPVKLTRTHSVPSPTTKPRQSGLKTPSPPRHPTTTGSVMGWGRTNSSLPDSPPGRPGLVKHTSVGFGLGLGQGGGAATTTRTIRTYGKRQEGGVGQQGAVGPGTSLGLAGPSTLSTPTPTDLESEINGFLHPPSSSSPEKHDLFQPLRGRPVPVQTDSYAELNKRFGVDVEDEDDFGPDSQGSLGDMKAPPSLADLRSRGENRRFLDELGYLRDGLRDQSLPARRSSAIDVLSKCTDAAWFDKLRICGQVELLYEDFAAARQDASDECLDLVLLLYFAHVSHNANDLEAVVTGQAEDICIFLLGVIRERRLTFALGASGRRKKNSSMDALREIRQSLKPMGLTESSALQRSPLAMASGILSLVLPTVLEAASKPHASLSNSDITVVLASTIQQELSELPTRIDLYVKGLDLFPPDHQCDFFLIIDTLGLLQDIIASEVDCKTVLQDSYVSVAPLFADLLLVLSHDIKAVALPREQVQEVVMLSLKMLLTLTQHSPSWSNAFLQGTSPYMGLLRLMLDHAPGRTHEDRELSPAASDDTLMSEQEDYPCDDGEVLNLALGCLFNIIQEANDNGGPILELTIGQPCQGHRSCLKQCRCSGGLSALHHLASIFVDQQKRKTDDPSAAFLSGYLALLFSRILEDEPEAVAKLLNALPGDNKQDQIKLLIANVIEFRNTYESFQQQVTKSLRRQLDADADMEIVVDDENSSNMIEHALKVYGTMV